jgi:hypothetical protein
LTEEDEKELCCLEKRLVDNVEIKLSTHWVSAWIYIICWGTLDRCNSPTGCRQTPTRSLPWKS